MTLYGFLLGFALGAASTSIVLWLITASARRWAK